MESETEEAQGDSSLDGALYGMFKGENLLDTYTTANGEMFIRDSTLPPNTLPAGKEQYLFSNKITLSSNSAKISSFQQPTRKDE